MNARLVDSRKSSTILGRSSEPPGPLLDKFNAWHGEFPQLHKQVRPSLAAGAGAAWLLPFTLRKLKVFHEFLPLRFLSLHKHPPASSPILPGLVFIFNQISILPCFSKTLHCLCHLPLDTFASLVSPIFALPIVSPPDSPNLISVAVRAAMWVWRHPSA